MSLDDPYRAPLNGRIATTARLPVKDISGAAVKNEG